LQTKQNAPAETSATEIDQAIRTDSRIRECQQEIERITEQIKAYERISALGKNDPAVARLGAKRDSWNDKLNERRETIAKAARQQAETKARTDFQARRESLETKLADLDEQEHKLAAEWNAVGGDDKVPARVQALRGEVAAKQETLRRLATELN